MTAARPIDAASLLIFRNDGRDLQVLMGRRRSKARFMPDVYVFPGGALDPEDCLARPATLPCPGLAQQVAVGSSRRRAVGLAMAAVREAWEETGLMLCRPGEVGEVSHASWRAFRRLGMAPDLGRLSYVGRAITPTESPLRFHARFFAAPGHRLSGRLAGDSELLDLRWVDWSARDHLPMVDVTQFMFDELRRMLRARRDRVPVMSYRGETVLVRYR